MSSNDPFFVMDRSDHRHFCVGIENGKRPSSVPEAEFQPSPRARVPRQSRCPTSFRMGSRPCCFNEDWRLGALMRAVAAAQGSTSRISFNACQRRGEHPVMRADVMSECLACVIIMTWAAPAIFAVGAPGISRPKNSLARHAAGWLASPTLRASESAVEGISTLHGGSEPHPPPPRNAGSLTA